jgi:1-deoxy-D-xylulose-5-phosphate reductoisomerase
MKGAPLQRSVTILGATGSIGSSAAAVIEHLWSLGETGVEVRALTVGRNLSGLVDLVGRLKPRFVAVADAALESEARRLLDGSGVRIGAGAEALVDAAREPADWVISAIVGSAALDPTLAAIERGARVALANKECLVCAGPLMLEAAEKSGATLLPVDSEHNAIFQVLDRPERIERVTLTASGGPFRTRTRDEMARASPAEALAHPNWSMGAKNSIDSATLMNKGLELIEAAHLFRLSESRIDVLVHPQSIVHSLVAYCDGSVLAQLSAPDMRIPIAYALAWPDRAETAAKRLDLAALGSLTFEAPDLERFPALKLARETLQTGGAATAVLNAANEVAVECFLSGRIGFLDIPAVAEDVLMRWDGRGHGPIANSPSSFDHVRAIDRLAREEAWTAISRRRAA